MNIQNFAVKLIVLFLITMLGSISLAKQNQQGGQGGQQSQNQNQKDKNKGDDTCSASVEQIRQCAQNRLLSRFDGLPLESLSETEQANILFMREEEKLARDVYLFLYELWDYRIFERIATAEQKHMDAILLLLDRYELTDPVAVDVAGEFVNQDLQNLYNSLTATGSTSAIDALIVGATIEELDILDLIADIEATDNQDITLIFSQLLKGSNNHLRAFVSTLKMLDYDYQPQYLTQEQYDEIMATPRQRGPKF